jgi:hypothetical protein
MDEMNKKQHKSHKAKHRKKKTNKKKERKKKDQEQKQTQESMNQIRTCACPDLNGWVGSKRDLKQLI